MKTFKCFILILTLSVLAACQGQDSGTVREQIRGMDPGSTTPNGTPSTPPPGSSQTGGVDSVGGGNGIDNRPLESYAKNITELSEFKEFVLPILQNMMQNNSRFASDLAHIALHRTWYLVPVELNKLPSQVVGVSFADRELQQLALQSLSSIWINSKSFAAYPTDKDRALLIIHELVMGVRLMKLKNKLDQCYSEVAYLGLDNTRKEDYKKQRDQCARSYGLQGSGGLLTNTKIELSKDDYENIRELVLAITKENGDISKTQLDAWLADKAFRSY